jgi:hypothetical protein
MGRASRGGFFNLSCNWSSVTVNYSIFRYFLFLGGQGKKHTTNDVIDAKMSK